MMRSDKIPALLLKINVLKEKMSKSEQRVADYIIEHASEVIYLSISELAEKSGVSDATVVRTCQKIGTSSYQDLKVSLAQDIVTPLQSVNEEITEEDSPADIIEKVFQSALHTLHFTYDTLNVQDIETAADKLMAARKICICGLGNSHAIALDMQHKLMRLGLNATAYTDNHMQMIAVSLMTAQDVLFAISHSGSSKDIVHCAEQAHQVGATIISLTSLGRSPLYNVSDIRLCTASKETKYRIVALSSRIAQMTIVDAIYTIIAVKNPDSTAGFHQIEKNLTYTKY